MEKSPLDSTPKTLYTTLGKRFLDIVIALVLGILFLPVVFGAALIIGACDGMNPFFLQRRMGMNRLTFIMFKLQTMKEDGNGAKAATRVGVFFRRCHLDEAPQLLNVLLGHMSIAGPRAMMWEFVETYAKEGFDYDYGLNVRPGITGYLQCRGPKKGREDLDGGIDIAERMAEELWYLRKVCLSVDLKIYVCTALVMLQVEWRRSGTAAHEAQTFNEPAVN